MTQDNYSQRIVFIGILLAGLLVANAWLSFRNMQKMYIDTGWVVRTHQAIETINKIVALMTVAEAQQRGYIITHDPAYLESYISTPAAISKQFQTLDNLIVDNPEQISRASVLKTDVTNRLKVMNDNLYVGKQKSPLRKNAMLYAGNKAMEKVSAQGEIMIAAENEVLNHRTQRFNDVHALSIFTGLLANFIAFMMFAAFCSLLRLYLINRNKTTTELGRLASIIDCSEDAIIGKDLNGFITYWNKGAEKLFGYTSQEAINQPITMLIPHDRMSEEKSILEKIYKGEKVEHYMTVRQGKDGRMVDVSLCISPIRDSHNVIIGSSKIVRDMTHQRKLEKDLRVSESRFRDLSEELLRSNKELEQFAFIASHDLKEPLTTIKSFADFLSRRASDKLEKKERDYLDSIKEAAVQGQVLVQDLLALSCVGKEDQAQVVDLDEIIKGVKVNLQMLIEESGVSIECNDSGYCQMLAFGILSRPIF